ncbi:MAG: hypothetical protein AAGA32_06980 [Pseudomonadota bacterium]
MEALPDRVLQAAARLRDTAMSGVSVRVAEDIALDPSVPVTVLYATTRRHDR